MTPVPFACNPGDRLRVTADKPYGTELVTGDLVTVFKADVAIENGVPLPIVKVYTSYGPQILGFDAVEPYEAPEYAPAEPDEIMNAQLRAMLSADKELLTLFTDADTALGAVEPEVSGQLGGGVVTDEATATNRRKVGPSFTFEDADGDDIEVVYSEQDCNHHGREGLFYITINDEGGVIIPADAVDPLIRYLFTRKKHSERDQ